MSVLYNEGGHQLSFSSYLDSVVICIRNMRYTLYPNGIKLPSHQHPTNLIEIE